MVKKIINLIRLLQSLYEKVDLLQQSIGRIELRQLNGIINKNALNHEFKVYSQSGEDGIIQWLVNNIEIKNKYFIEFGVENYLESNTRFLLINNYWSGLVIDGDISNINYIKQDPIYWRCNLKACNAFITKDNINELFKSYFVPYEVGILSIDIDGNDYWVLEAIKNINPAIIITEYNSYFGPIKKVTVPYDESFIRSNAHYSKIYYGASISAFVSLLNSRGYKLVASNFSGNNIFFVREDLLNSIVKEISVDDAYRKINFREVHDVNGKLCYSDFFEAKKVIDDLKVYDLEDDSLLEIKNL